MNDGLLDGIVEKQNFRPALIHILTLLSCLTGQTCMFPRSILLYFHIRCDLQAPDLKHKDLLAH